MNLEKFKVGDEIEKLGRKLNLLVDYCKSITPKSGENTRVRHTHAGAYISSDKTPTTATGGGGENPIFAVKFDAAADEFVITTRDFYLRTTTAAGSNVPISSRLVPVAGVEFRFAKPVSGSVVNFTYVPSWHKLPVGSSEFNGKFDILWSGNATPTNDAAINAQVDSNHRYFQGPIVQLSFIGTYLFQSEEADVSLSGTPGKDEFRLYYRKSSSATVGTLGISGFSSGDKPSAINVPFNTAFTNIYWLTWISATTGWNEVLWLGTGFPADFATTPVVDSSAVMVGTIQTGPNGELLRMTDDVSRIQYLKGGILPGNTSTRSITYVSNVSLSGSTLTVSKRQMTFRGNQLIKDEAI